MTQPRHVTITEVGTRDGFQMEADFIATETKIAVLNALIAAGVRSIEATSFVSPRAIPQLRDAADVLAAIERRPDTRISCLVPNPQGAERAVAARIDMMVLFVSSTETFNMANLNRPIADTLDGLPAIAGITQGSGIALQGAVAGAFGCPFEGDVPIDRITGIVARMRAAGITGITLGDTTGMATPALVRALVGALQADFPDLPITLHFHNTRGLGLVNVMAGLELGIDHFESSIGGLGGCPFAPGATGNVCTEDLVNLLRESRIETGIDLDALIGVARQVERVIGRTLPGQVMKAGTRRTLHVPRGPKRVAG